MKPRRRKYVIAVCVVCLIPVGGYLLLLLIGSLMEPRKTTDVNEYPSVVEEWSPSGLAKHFPATVPPEASNVRFSACPKFLQGGGYIQLRMKLPAKQIQQIEAQLRTATTHVYAGGGFNDHYNRDQKNNLPTATFHTADNPTQGDRFPEHYILYVLHAKDRGMGSWNHGDTFGAAVSSVASEVIYWAEAW